MSDVPGFLQQMEQKAETFFHNMEAEVKAVVHPEAAAEAGNAPVVAAESATAPAIAEVPNAAPIAPDGAATPAAGEDPNVGASLVAFSVDESTPPSVKDALKSVSESPIAASSAAEPKTFEQMVEERFMTLEAAFLKLPESIATVMHRGSMAPEEFAAAVHAHLFGKQ